MNPPLVNLQVIGVQKAGTSALAHFLSQHPDVCVVEGKEAHVFDQPDFDKQNKSNYAYQRYAKKLAHYQGEKVICDATPITIFNPQFLQDCYEYNTNAKFILLLRDPVERAVSHFYMSKQRGREKRNMLWGFMMEGWRLNKVSASEAWKSGSVWRENSYLARGEYKKQLDNLFKTIPRDQCLILNQEKLLAHHDNSLKQVFEFLNIEEHAIGAETVCSSNVKDSDKTEKLARLFAKTYYFLKGEYPYRYW